MFYMVSQTSRHILSANLRALMASHAHLDTLKKITGAGGPSNGTLDRIRRMESGCSIDELDKLARIFELESWQLLVPDLDPTNPPMLAHVTERQRELYEKLKQVAKTLR
jgi:hypothetical protein